MESDDEEDPESSAVIVSSGVPLVHLVSDKGRGE
jgi:hypothetical protein